MARDPIRDLLDTPSDDDQPDGPMEGSYWSMTLMSLGPNAEPGPSWDVDVTDAEKRRIQADPGQSEDEARREGPKPWRVFETLEFSDMAGSRHTWYFCRIVSFVESTPETRHKDRLKQVWGQLHGEKLLKEQRKKHLGPDWSGGGEVE